MSNYHEEYTQILKDKLAQEGNVSLSDPILCLTTRLKNALKNIGITTINDLLDKTESDLLSSKNMGRKSLNEAIDLLNDFGLCLKKTPARPSANPKISMFEVNIRLQHLADERDRIDAEIKRLQALSAETTQTTEAEQVPTTITTDIEALSGGNPHLAKLILVGELTGKQASILRERIAGKTYREIGESMGFSATYAQQVERKTLRRLGHPSRRLNLQPELQALGLLHKSIG